MNVEKKQQMGIVFVGALFALLSVFYLITGFKSGIKDVVGAVYFALWVTAVMGVWIYLIQPYLKERPKKQLKSTTIEPEKAIPIQSPRANLPLRDRIREYVAERRKEENLPIPEPLRPSRSSLAHAASTSSTPSSGGYGATSAPLIESAEEEITSTTASGEGDLPLPDDFEEEGSPDLFGEEYSEEGTETSLPGLDDEDFGSYEDTSMEEEAAAESEDVPDFEGSLEENMDDAGLLEPLDDTSTSSEVDEGSQEELDGGGLSDEGLADFDMPLDESMMDDDLSGDGDLSDIEFDDLEPDDV